MVQVLLSVVVTKETFVVISDDKGRFESTLMTPVFDGYEMREYGIVVDEGADVS